MRSPNKILTDALTLVLLSLLLTGCLKSSPPPAFLKTQLLSSIHLNPNSVGNLSPNVVRYYELNSSALFETNSFFALTDPDRNILGQDLLGQDEVEIPPRAEQIVNRELSPFTRYIGVVTAYRDLKQARWRVVLPVKPHAPNAFIVRLGKADIIVSEPATERTAALINPNLISRNGNEYDLA